MCSESVSVTSFRLLERDIRNLYTPNMMYDGTAVGVARAFGVGRPFSLPLPLGGKKGRKEWSVGEGWAGASGLDHRLQKSRIICTFSIEEKVRAIRQLKKEAIILDEDRWLVLVG